MTASRRLSTVFVGVAIAAFAARSPAQVRFHAPEIFELGEYSSAAADFDEDGHLDIVSASLANRLSVHLGSGDGRFGSPVDPGPTVEFPQFVTVGDWNEDGHMDIAAADYSVGASVFLGDGDGGFGPVRRFATRTPAVSICTADFDSDGHLDLVVAGRDYDSVSVLLGDGNGGFGPARHAPAGGRALSVVAADFDLDGRMDMAVATRDLGVAILLGHGDGEFEAPAPIELPSYCEEVITADFDDDGTPDLCVVTPTTGTSILLGDGTGSFAFAGHAASEIMTNSAVAADLNEDGHLDIAVTEYQGQGPWIAIGDGDGGFGEPYFVYTGVGSGSIISGDFDENGHPDLCARGVVTGGVGNGEFVVPRQMAVEPRPEHVTLADFDANGLTDIAVTSAFILRGELSLWLADGHGGFQLSTTTNPGNSALVAVTSDFNLDGNLDVAVAGRTSLEAGNVAILDGDGRGGFGAPRLTPVGSFGNGVMGCEIVEDFDRDGFADLAVVGNSARNVSVLLGDGLGGFRSRDTYAMPLGPSAVVAADLENDGDLDLVVGNRAEPGLSALLGDGTGSFGAAEPIAALSNVRWVDAADFNEDGFVDLVAAECCSSFASILLGDGIGGFSAPQEFGFPGTDGHVDTRIALADLDADGHVDVMVTGDTFVQILLGDGSGGFPIAQRFAVWPDTRCVAAGDVFGAGHMDLVLSSHSSAALTVLRNRTFDGLDSRRGNVNGGVGPVTDVVFVNGSPGGGPERRITVDKDSPLRIQVTAPLSKPTGPSPFALYVWPKEPTNQTVVDLPFGLGLSGFPTPLDGGSPRPFRIADNVVRFEARLGVENWPGPRTTPAPSVALDLTRGLGRPARFYVQGFIVDAAAPNGRAAVTNGVAIVVQ